MVKPDVKHNYYADLDLPTTATVDDVRKAYRKLALQYHPDRNAGKEDECVPRFQAIQAANEVLSDATTKAKYDADRRKAGLYPAQTFKPNVPSPGNPYSARSDFPPPPRRTQPGTWAGHRPTASTAAGSTPSGADRFTNFPRPHAAAPRKDPAADRTQQFRAWQNMNNPQPERPRYAAPQPPPREPQPQARPPPPNVPNRPRMNRQDTKIPTEEQIRAGMRYGNASAPAGDEAEAANRQSAWAAFQKSNAGQPGMARKGRAPTTPKRPTGFDPNAPGSDERPATGHYVHRHKSADLTADGFPPPPPGPPPSAPSSPLSPNTQRPFADPLRPFRSRNSNDDAPYSEANRTSTPYSSFSGEKTAFSSDGLRRSVSVRDNTKLSPESATSGHSRARSVDPAARQRQAEAARENGNKGRPTFMAGYSSSSGSSSPEGSSGPDPTESPEELSDEPPAKPQDPKDRPKKKPTPPSARFPNGTRSTLAGDGNTTDPEKPSMQQKAAPNMYDTPSTSAHHYTPPSLFNRPEFRTAFASRSTAGGKAGKPSIAPWAIPSSISPSLQKKRRQSASPTSSRTTLAEQSDHSDNQDTLWQQASQDERDAFHACRLKLSKICGDIAQLNQFDLDTFRKAVRVVLQAGSTGTRTLDSIFANIISQYPSIAHQDSSKEPADSACPTNSFTVPVDHETFQPTRGKSRSVEEINTNFSPEPFAGRFQGSGDYFAPSPNGRRPSPSLRSGSSRAQRANTTDSTPASKPSSPMPPPPFVREPNEQRSRPPSMYGTPVDGKFNPDHWSEALKDAHSWAVPGPPPNPPLSKAPSSKGSRPSSKSQPGPTLGTDKSPHVVDDNDDVVEVDRNGHPVASGGAADDGDAMDIDTPPRPTDAAEQAAPLSSSANEPRLYSVPPSQWRQEQAQSYSHNRQTSSSSRRAQRKSGQSDLKTNLDSLRHTIPLEGGKDGLNELADLSSSLPYASKASSTLPTEGDDPPEVKLPQYPKAPSGPTKLTKASWTEYAQKFANYLLGHHMWNRSMLEHFNRREPQAEACMSHGTDWLSASGDTVNGAPGFGEYCKAVKQDQKWRTAWQVGCDKHLQNVNDFEQMRSRVKQSAENGILANA